MTERLRGGFIAIRLAQTLGNSARSATHKSSPPGRATRQSSPIRGMFPGIWDVESLGEYWNDEFGKRSIARQLS